MVGKSNLNRQFQSNIQKLNKNLNLAFNGTIKKQLNKKLKKNIIQSLIFKNHKIWKKNLNKVSQNNRKR